MDIIKITVQDHNDQEIKATIIDLLQENSFELKSEISGPFHIKIEFERSFILNVFDSSNKFLQKIPISLDPFIGIIKDYSSIIKNYELAIKSHSLSRLEAIDMGRRSLHNEASELLINELADYVSIDFNTARRFFTLLVLLLN